MKFLILLILFSGSVFSDAIISPAAKGLLQRICHRGYVNGLSPKDLKDREEILSAFQERKKMSAAIRKELRPFNKELELIYKKGDEMRAHEARYMTLSRIKNPKKEVLDEMHDLDMKWTFLSQEMNQINNSFVTKMHAIYKKKGLPAKLVEDEKGILVMQLDFSKPPTDKHGFEFYRKVSERFGVQNITMSLKDNAAKSFRGYFNGSASRIEMGPDQAVGLLQEYINTTGKHESRHAMFFAKRNRGAPSIFHTQFRAQGEKLLNDAGMYESYMSAEEIYTFSTDLQTLAQAFKGEMMATVQNQKSMLIQTADKAGSLGVISDATVDFTGSFIKSLTDQLSRKKPIDISINPQKNGMFEINVADEFGRVASINLVSTKEKAVFGKIQKMQEDRAALMDSGFRKVLESKGINPQNYFEKMQSNALSLEEQNLMTEFASAFEFTPAGVALEKSAENALREVLIASKLRLEKIQKVARHQSEEVEVLNKLLKTAYKDPTPQNIQIVKNQMFRMAKNVKEDYKGFILRK